MPFFDLRYALPIVINGAKSQVSMPRDWDPFNTIGHLTWPKLWLLIILFVIFSFTSIEVPLTCPVIIGHIRVQVGKLSTSLLVLLAASLLFPQVLFWYAYPMVILLSSCSSWLSSAFKSFLQWVKITLCTVPDLNIFVSATYTDEVNPEPQPMSEGTMEPTLEDEVGLV
ncbi:hypothetical protein NMG60_11027466 [Bertholletia excelsa]